MQPTLYQGGLAHLAAEIEQSGHSRLTVTCDPFTALNLPFSKSQATVTINGGKTQ